MTHHPNRSSSYTIRNRHGEVQSQGETMAAAAQIVLWHDSNEYEIRRGDSSFELWTSPISRASAAYKGLTRSVISSSHTDQKLAEADIYRQVIRNAEWWGGMSVCTDADYAAELAEINAQDNAN